MINFKTEKGTENEIAILGYFKSMGKCHHMTKSFFTCFLGHFILLPDYFNGPSSPYVGFFIQWTGNYLFYSIYIINLKHAPLTLFMLKYTTEISRTYLPRLCPNPIFYSVHRFNPVFVGFGSTNQGLYIGWIPRNFKTIIFEPWLSFLAKNHKNDN